ncbi:hypothetical protein [Mucilaginibacter pedocola]|uniref:Uncharacterized protein n=1 Tax=Mucilaginibacter pedocola TaxID=1792845 RepID=A0A1S9P7H5_9SPHI|nr:hypothetical protein [Mucilaginibacter pedocola]OOQ56889.1 hypothetical protein BC343_18095 [Mucilaginibacter pedocola]
MPRNHNPNDDGQVPGRTAPKKRKSAPIINLTVNTGANQVEDEYTNRTPTEHQGNDIKVNVVNAPDDNSLQIEANKIATTANKISNNANYLNAGLFLLTIILAGISIWQGVLTRRSIEVANKTFLADSSNNERVYIRDSLNKIQSDIADAAKLKRDTDFVNKQKKGIDAQIRALQETQNQFKIANEPYLQLTEVRIDSAIIGKPYYIKYTLANLGNYPVKILNTDFYSAIRVTDAGIKTIKSNNEKSLAGDYIVKGNAIVFIDQTSKIVTQENINKILGDGYFWTSGIIKYQNLVSHQIKSYKFNIKIKLNGVFTSTYNLNRVVK